MELELRRCIECNNYFMIENDTDAVCNECAGSYKPHHLSNYDLYGRDWENKTIRRQWQKNAKRISQRLDAKYSTIYKDKNPKINDPLLNKRIVVE